MPNVSMVDIIVIDSYCFIATFSLIVLPNQISRFKTEISLSETLVFIRIVNNQYPISCKLYNLRSSLFELLYW